MPYARFVGDRGFDVARFFVFTHFHQLFAIA